MVRYVKASGNVQTLAYLRKHTQGCGGRAGSDCMERAGCGQEGGVEFAKAPAATSVPYGYHLPHSCQSLPHSGSGLPCFHFFQKDLLSCFSMLTLMFLNVGSELKKYSKSVRACQCLVSRCGELSDPWVSFVIPPCWERRGLAIFPG